MVSSEVYFVGAHVAAISTPTRSSMLDDGGQANVCKKHNGPLIVVA